LILLALFASLLWLGWRFFLPANDPASEVRAVVSEEESVLQIAQSQSFAEPDSCVVNHSVSGKKKVVLPLMSILLVALVIVVTLKLNTRHALAPFVPQEYGQAQHIQNTFTEAKLEPPAPLPPDVFVNAIAERPGLATADRDWSKLNPQFMQQVLQLMKKMEERGYRLALLEGYRSAERQDSLAQLANVVTKAKGGQSKHQYGLAVDLAPIKNGKVVISEKDPWALEAYQAMGEEAIALGLTWGGKWSFKDYGHIEKAGSLAVLLQNK
jgi:peptidoglycan L-alanyl-D-glutamate endopeptidase CwlK